MFETDIFTLKEKGLYREIFDREGEKLESTRITIGGVEYINFSSNDYLGLASSSVLADAAKKALEKYPFGAGASRLLSGGSSAHKDLEKKIASFKGVEDALLFNSGYQANVSVIQAIASEDDIIFSDELNHASIIDGCRLSKARKLVYRHRDIEHLALLMERNRGKKNIIITDTVFSMDGDIAPLDKIYSLCCSIPDSILYIDDAHGTGVIGKGKGALAHFNIKPEPWIIQMGTLSKAVGSFGAFIAGDRGTIDWLKNSARGLIYSTALPSCVAAASLAAIELIENKSEIIEKLEKNRKKAVDGVKKAGFRLASEDTPIIAILFDKIEDAQKCSMELGLRGIYAPAIRPPTVKQPRVRITVSAAHSDKDIDILLKALNEIKNYLF